MDPRKICKQISRKNDNGPPRFRDEPLVYRQNLHFI